jgi:8-hydroxy-5-deazaflavin:NADPH oxidoreductase
VKIGVIGAGTVGGNLGARLSNSGFEVKFGVREVDDKVKALLGRTKGATTGTPDDAAAWGDVVFLAVPGNVTLEVAKGLAKHLQGKVVVDCNNPVTWGEGPVWNPPPEGSLAQAIAKAAPGTRVIKGFNTLGAEFHGDPNHAGPPAQVFFAGDDAEAKKTFTEVATKGGWRPVDAGPLRNASVLENVAILWMHLALVAGHGRDWTFIQARKG